MSISTIAIGENHPSSVVFLHAISVGYICMLVNAQGLQYTADYLQKMIWEFKRFYVLRIVAPFSKKLICAFRVVVIPSFLGYLFYRDPLKISKNPVCVFNFTILSSYDMQILNCCSPTHTYMWNISRP